MLEFILKYLDSILQDKPHMGRLAMDFGTMMYNLPEEKIKELDPVHYEIFLDLADDLDHYVQDPKLRTSPSYFGDDVLESKIKDALVKLNRV